MDEEVTSDIDSNQTVSVDTEPNASSDIIQPIFRITTADWDKQLDSESCKYEENPYINQVQIQTNLPNNIGYNTVEIGRIGCLCGHSLDILTENVKSEKITGKDESFGEHTNDTTMNCKRVAQPEILRNDARLQ